MQNVSFHIEGVFYKKRHYWAVYVYGKWKCKSHFSSYAGAYFSRGHSAWLVPQSTIPCRDCLIQLLNCNIAQLCNYAQVSNTKLIFSQKISVHKIRFATLQNLLSAPQSLKYRVMMKLLLYAELSIDQTCNLTLEMIDFSNRKILLPWDNSFVFINSMLWDQLIHYIHSYKPKCYLFEERPNEMFSNEKLLRCLQSYKKQNFTPQLSRS